MKTIIICHGPNPQPFKAYIIGAAVPDRFVVHQGLVIPLPLYQVYDWLINKLLPSPIANFKLIAIINLPSSREEKTTISRCGLKRL